MDELGKRNGHHEDGGGENDRNDPCLIDFERQEAVVPAVHLPSDDALCVLDRNPALSFIDFDDYCDHREGNDEEEQALEGADGPDLEIFDDRIHRIGETSHNAGKDDQGNAVADAFFCDLFADPHEKARAGRQYDADEEDIEPAVVDQRIVDPQSVCHAEGLDKAEEYCAVTGHFLDLFISFLTVFAPFFKGRNDCGQQLHDNGGIDVRSNAHREDGEFTQRTAGK